MYRETQCTVSDIQCKYKHAILTENKQIVIQYICRKKAVTATRNNPDLRPFAYFL